MKDKQNELVTSVIKDFKERQEARRPLELNWRLNMNFVIGNQYAEISPRGDIEERGKQYFWQSREVYNHIAPILETRLSKLAKVKAKATVRPQTNDDGDISSAKLATKLLNAVEEENNFSGLMSSANTWSEITGSAFYKIVWDGEKGKALDADATLKEGDVAISVCSPFEIFPEDLAVAEIEKQPSIMHAKVMTVDDVKTLWGIDVDGSEIGVFTFDNTDSAGGFGYTATVPRFVSEKKDNSVLVIEKYSKPTSEYPNGRLIIIAGDALVFDGDLPFVNGEEKTRTYPFAKQHCLDNLGSFFGSSVVERIIPVQRAYNTVKNRKHEFMNRIAMGVLAVEDGSVDTDNLEEEGLSPGKVLIYRQGSTPPMMMNAGQVPSEFSREEEKLLNEFVMISGVSEVTTYSQVPANVSSGTAISLLLEQDDTRISLTADSIREAVRKIGKHIIRLYKQYAKTERIMRVAGDNGEIEITEFKASALNSEDIVFDTVNEIEDNISTRRAMVYDLLKLGLFTDESGVMSNRTRGKLFEILGFGNWENGRDLDEAHISKAMRENLLLENEAVTPDVVDDHKTHIVEHTKLAISQRCGNSPEFYERVLRHITAHREFSTLDADVSELERKMEEL
ncbi:MAG: hypothetical protein IKD35_02575 [Clostridia bacterium]|nr:hypothetical protein [Clostridia bacterium]